MVIALALAAYGGDETTTVTETAGAETGGKASATETGTGEAAEEEVAEPDAFAQQEIDAIQAGLEGEQAVDEAGWGRRRYINRRRKVDVSGSAPPAPNIEKAKAGLQNARYCAAGVVAGPNTSCAFAINVAYDYFNLGRARRFISYSPVTGEYYRVRCKGVHPTICRAGNGALIAIA